MHLEVSVELPVGVVKLWKIIGNYLRRVEIKCFVSFDDNFELMVD